MNKKLLIMIAFLLLIIPSMAFANKLPFEEAVISANEEIQANTGEPNYYDIKKVNKEMYERYGVLVYGSPHGDKKGDMTRYVGYTPDGNPFGNPVFPKDAWAGGTYDSRKWIENPWEDNRTKAMGASYNDFNGNEKYNDNMIAALKKYYPKDTDGSITDWHKYMQILQPPTQYTPGQARIWHIDKSGKIWYAVMPLLSMEETIRIIDDPLAGPPELDEPQPPVFEPIEPPVLEPIPLLAPIVLETPRASNLAVKWDSVPVKIGGTSLATGKIERNVSRTWNEYKYVVDIWYPNEATGKKIGSSVIKTVPFSSDVFLKGKSEVTNAWFNPSGKPSYSVPSNTKPGTVLIVKLQVLNRVHDNFPSIGSQPSKPQPEVRKPSHSRPSKPSRPSRPSSPGKDASPAQRAAYSDALSRYRDRLDSYYEKLERYYILKEPWDKYDAYISSPAYKEYLKRMEDYNKLKAIRSTYNENKDGNPSIIGDSGYNFTEYKNIHTSLNNFVNSHQRRFVSIEGDAKKLYWFSNKTSFSEATSKNVVIHSVPNAPGGGLDPGIIIVP